ncbi:MAG: response regulator [Hyphomicrobium sp.]
MQPGQDAGLPRTAASRILLADDDPIIRSILAAKLATLKLGASDIVEAEDGHAAWEHLVRGDFQLAIVDLEMPNIDGFELIQCMRSHPRTKHIPIVVVTSREDPEALKAALEAGASSYLTKPIYWSMFSTHIEHLLRLSQTSRENSEALERANAQVQRHSANFAALMNDVVPRLSRIAKTAEDLMFSPARTAAASDREFFLTITREAETAQAALDHYAKLALEASAGQISAPVALDVEKDRARQLRRATALR